MTFIDMTGGAPSPGLIAGYSILSVVSLACTGWAVHLGRTRLHYHSFFSVRVLFPLALFILTLENIALALSGLIYKDLENDGVDNNYDSNLFMKAIFILQPFEVPILLVVMFELTYLVHKRRSVNFCGMYFDEGRRVYNTAVMSCMLRNSIRSLATLLLIMGLLVNLDVHRDGAAETLAGRAGWFTFFTIEGSAYDKIHLLLSLIPVAVLVLVCFYLSVMLWRYGTQSSMVVHSSICNPWFYPFFGTVAMAVGQIFGPALYPVMSNTGILLFIITLLALMAEVDKDIVATHDVACFLVQVAKKGDEISVTAQSRAAQSVRQSYMDSVQQQNISSFRPFSRQSFIEEEKTMESTDFTKRTSNIVHRLSTDVTEPTSNVNRSVRSTDVTEHVTNTNRSLSNTEDTKHSSTSSKVKNEVSDEVLSSNILDACDKVEETNSVQIEDESNPLGSGAHSSVVTDEETGHSSDLNQQAELELAKEIHPPRSPHREDEARVMRDEQSSLVDKVTREAQILESKPDDSKIEKIDMESRKSPNFDNQCDAELTEEINPPCPCHTKDGAEVVSDENALLIDEERGLAGSVKDTLGVSNVEAIMDEQTRKLSDSAANESTDTSRSGGSSEAP
ncbi:hypothetical protein HJC23_006884 [Cyclotella cryptica]|uniref:Uncharacterized protein n=1 Tax=Cyclotella cryptica TaxID=29204 RepID=A0ABD3QDA7_9STRA|eukprot:CCRYP_006713-RB/>CCRYP_006713-RB protein AED:0.05 eAED:0.05 QI:204/1/1/1/0.5/0.33/3/275/619